MAKSKVTSIRSTGQAPLAARPLPDEARQKLAELVAEVRGASKLLYLDEVTTPTRAARSASGWSAVDLGAMECRSYPAESTEAK